MLGKTILFSGGKYDIAFIKQYLADMSFDTVACADSGLEAAHAVGVNVDYIMGILTVYRKRHWQSIDLRIRLQSLYSILRQKTIRTRRWYWNGYCRKGHQKSLFWVLPGTIDHFLSNLNILMKPLKQGIPAYIVDSHNRLYLIDGETTLHREQVFGKYISLQPLSEEVYP